MSIGMGSFSLVESTNNNCAPLTYSECKEREEFLNEFLFSILDPNAPVEIIGGGAPSIEIGTVSYRPEVRILAPRGQSAVAAEALIEYQATDRNDLSGGVQKTELGLSSTPVSLFYTDKIAEWDYSLIGAADKVLIAKGLPASGTYIWNTKGLLPGVQYRIIVDAIDNAGDVGEELSDFFSLDLTTPLFIVKADPPAVQKEDVRIIVDASEALSGVPTVTVTQKGGKAVPVAMSGDELHYEGVYKVLEGHDGVALVSVTATDRAGNKGTSRGTFAVGIEPPPTPVILFPRAGASALGELIEVSGSVREDTTAVLTVNGTTLYEAKAAADGSFVIKNVRLNKTDRQGRNLLSVVARDGKGIVGQAATREIKFNKAPVVTPVRPIEGATASAASPFEVKATDENNDILLYTYAVIPAREFGASTSATSTEGWTIIAEGARAARFVWDTTEAEDGEYYFKAIVSDGMASVASKPVSFLIKNILPFFRFEDGRKTLTSATTVIIKGRALVPENQTSRGNIAKIEYSTDNGKKWTAVSSAISASPEQVFAVTFNNLEEGTLPILWRVTDSRNLTGRASHPIVIDRTPPAAPSLLSLHTGIIISDKEDDDAIRKGIQLPLKGASEPQSTVTILFGGVTYTEKALADGTFILRGVTLATRGRNEIKLFSTDQAGNKGATATISFVYDNLPTVTFIRPVRDSGVHGKVALSWSIKDADSDRLQNVSVSYRKGSGNFITLVRDPRESTFLWDVSGFAEAGGYQLRIEASDGIGTTTAIANIFVDNTPPTLETFSLTKVTLKKGEPFEGKGTARDALSGIETVEFNIRPEGAARNERNWFKGIVTGGFLAKTASFSLKYPLPLEDGAYEILARAVDRAGNVSGELSRKVAVDSTPPRVGSFLALGNGISIPPDREGILSVYAKTPLSFGISLEGDTARASVVVGGRESALTHDVATGLWETVIDGESTSTESVILLIAEDNAGNRIEKKKIGMLQFIEQGSALFLDADERRLPIPDAAIRVLVFNKERGRFVAQSKNPFLRAAVTDENGRYSLALPQGTYQLVMQKIGFKTIKETLTLERGEFIQVAFISEREKGGIRAFFQSVLERVILLFK